MKNPTPEEIREVRKAAGLTQTQAGALLHTTCRTWQQWEKGDRKMHPAFWEMFQMKIGFSIIQLVQHETETNQPPNGEIEN